jgi:hypothetical protein
MLVEEYINKGKEECRDLDRKKRDEERESRRRKRRRSRSKSKSKEKKQEFHDNAGTAMNDKEIELMRVLLLDCE